MNEVRYRLLDAALARRAIPDVALRLGALLGAFKRERRESDGGVEQQELRLRQLVEHMSTGAIAEAQETANEQHYELPARFLASMLGPRLKYSCCLWQPGVADLAQAEEAMLEAICGRARVGDGMRVLDLGCGWGSLSLWLAERYPTVEVTAVSNSHRQRIWIEQRTSQLGLSNLRAVTADVNTFAPEGRFDRVISIEMFEHMRNWRELLRRISTWLARDGKLFVHIFTHRTLPYRFSATWAAKRFFTAGLMPSHELLLSFQRHLEVEDRWAINGLHYAKTLSAWQHRLDDRAEEAQALLRADGRTSAQARLLLGRWRLFLIATAEMWGYRGGEAWMVSHYLLRPRP